LLVIQANAQSVIMTRPRIIGKLSAAVLNEVSGLTLSRVYKQVFYVHNDSGDGNRFFAINTKGDLVTTYYFIDKANNSKSVKDCEDIAIGPGPVKGRSYIYLADIGDNLSWRSSVQVYRFREPATVKEKEYTIDNEVLNLEYPDGPRDAETILIDPLEKMMYIISKREDSAGIYRCSLNFSNNDTVKLQRCGKLYLEGARSKKWIVSGDISVDGKQVILKTVENVYYWRRQNNEPVYQTLQRRPKRQAAFISHGQEEAIAFDQDGKGYYIASEGAGSKIYYYPLEK